MSVIQPCELPQNALLNKYKREGVYTDCYFVELPETVSHAGYVAAFYTSAVFKVERRILSLLVLKPSSDRQAKQLANDEIQTFAAWRVEDRTANQLLLCDFLGQTRSWLMCVVNESGDSSSARLYFGSAVVPKVNPATGRATFGFAFHALLGFHKLYSRALLWSACSRLARIRRDNQ
jgi:hypothetical protein